MMRVLAYTVVAGLSAGMAQACSVAQMTPSDTPVYGEACAVSTVLGEFRAAGLSSATDLGGGFVRQEVIDGNACAWESNLLVHDCAGDALLVVGWEDRDMMASLSDPDFETGLMRITAGLDQAAQQGAPLRLAAIADLARAEGLPTALELSGGALISVNGYGVSTSCVCKTYYP